MRILPLTVHSCKDCPNKDERNPYSSDGWDMMIDWYCKITGEKIAGAVEWRQENKIKIPDWCPLPKAETSSQ